MPELVHLDSVSNTYAVNYDGFIPILIESYKAQNNEISQLKKELILLKQQLHTENRKYTTNTNDKGLKLSENIPNPFSSETTIEFYIPSNVITANLMVYDLQGKQILNQNITDRENGSITITGTTLDPGIYLYGIIADGTFSGAKQMVITD